jgi:ribosomal protein S27AE
MPIRVIPPGERYRLDDPFHQDRWMCTRCGLVFDYLFEPGELGWPDFDPPLHQANFYYDEEGEIQVEEPDRSLSCPRCGLEFEGSPPILVALAAMTRLEDLLPMIAQGEGTTIDFMVDFPANASHLRDAIAAFATTEGGRIFIGVDNSGAIVGLAGIDSAAGKEAFQSRVRGLLGGIAPKPEIQVDFLSSDAGATIAMISVPRGPSPIYLSNNVPYIRELDQSRPATAEEIERLVTKRSRRRGPPRR